MYKEDLALNNQKRLTCHKTRPKQNVIYLKYMNKDGLTLNNLQWLICHKIRPNHLYIYIYIYKEGLALNSL